MLLPDGSARVTEFDGEQWIVSGGGIPRPNHRNQKLGTDPKSTSGAAPAYEADDGDELEYYGRGFVQLTWWSNYAATGALIGRGLDLLLDPELVSQPELAYKIMSTVMRTGAGFANRNTFAKYFHADHTDYVHARAMVNGHSHEREIGALAERFEKVLFAATAVPGEVGVK